ncbi:RNA polymerase sigma factor [Celeribacter sp.]|uniref:RNA polymerase sigma factor n=1 Tax=Celeribacter sp. TaxID=1890673 RepID=UPI003A956849
MGKRLDQWVSDIFRQYHRDLITRATRMVGDRDTGEDIVQSTYVKLVAGAKSSSEIANPRAYTFTALRNVAYDFTARRSREWLYRVDHEEIEAFADDHDTESQLAAREALLRLSMLLNELPASCSDAFLMNKVEGLTHREIAKRMGISTSMVEKHIMRAIKHCRDVMSDL